ncbi:MAG TPA: hypothetical protein VN256_14165 [Pyrinomonadaceae bacterium]|nr:hypothetical protein [Pyrinomonadaceae bacterium]
MKKLGRICAGLILVLALSLPALAGDMLTPPGAGGETQFPGVAGDTQFPGVTGEIGFPGLLAALFSFF